MTATFEALFRSLDFERPLDVSDPKDKALYVTGMHTAEGVSPVDELRAGIEMSDRPGTWLFTGHRGVGKSTELRRMANDLRGQGHLVIVADMGEYLNLVEPVKTETLLLTMVAAMADGADQFLGGARLEASYSTRLWEFLKTTEVNFTEASAQLPLGDAKLSFKAQLKDNPGFREKVVASVQGSVAHLAAQVRAFAKSVLEDMRKQRGADKQVVLILDSLERLALDGWGDANTAAGRGSEALAAHRESLDIRRQLHQNLGDSPQVLDDLAVSLERMAQLDGVVQADRLASVREALALRERLVAATRQSPYHVARLATAQRLAQRIGQELPD